MLKEERGFLASLNRKEERFPPSDVCYKCYDFCTVGNDATNN